MDEDPLISSNNEKQQQDDEDEDDDDSSTENPTPCLTQSSFLVPKINLGKSSPSSTCGDALGATITYGLISTPGIPPQNNQELFVLDKHLLTKKLTLNPMAKEFKPSARKQFSRNDYSSVVGTPGKLCPPCTYKTSASSSNADDKLISHIAEILKNDKLLILMRGCPGSGKSTLAMKIYHSLEKSKSGVILSTDNYFNMNGSHYQYDSIRLPGAHAWNKSQAFTAMTENTDLIIIDNTNVAKWEMEPYVKLAFEKSYKVELVEPNTRWKFHARRLVEHNVHGVNLSKIQDMLSRYERNVSVEQLLSAKKPQDENCHTDRNTAKAKRKAPHRKKKKADHSRGPNKNKDNNSNSDNYSTSPPEMFKIKDFFANDKPEERFPAIPRAGQELPAFPSAHQELPVFPSAHEEWSDSESWGSDEWYEPQAQRLPKTTVQTLDKTDNQLSDDESSAENFQEEVFDILQSLNKEKLVVEDLAVLALKCIEKFGNDEIYESASLATVEGCKRKNEILLENFERKNSKKPFDQGFTPLTKDEDNLSPVACSMECLRESPRSSATEDSADMSPEEQNEFYLIFTLKSDFTNLLAQMFGPIDNLNNEEADQEGNINLKLNYDDMKCLHQTLSKICAVKKGIGSCKKKKDNKIKIFPCIYSPMSSSPKEGFVPPPVSLAEIMKEQEESMFQLEQKMQKKDRVSTNKLKKLCLEFPGYDPNVIEDIFKENDYDMHKTIAVLQGHPQHTAIDWRFISNTVPTQTAPQNKPRKTNGRFHLNWLKILEQDQTEAVEFYHERLKDSIKKRDMYCNGQYYKAASYFQEKVGEFKVKLQTAQLNLLKQNVASLFTLDTYNKIDLHGMNKRETGYIVYECLKDYTEALENSSSMKRHLIFITGKGSNSKNKKSVLQPYLINFLEMNNYQFVKEEGQVKVFI